MVMCPKTILPSAVAGPTAAKALQCSALAAGMALGFRVGSFRPSRPFGRASRPPSSVSISAQQFKATMSVKSIARPSNWRRPQRPRPLFPAFLRDIPESNLRRNKALVSRRTLSHADDGSLDPCSAAKQRT